MQYSLANGTSKYHYYVYKVKVDQFSSLKLNGLSILLKNNSAASATLTFQFQNQANGTTFPIIINNTNTSQLQRSVISAVINTVSGGYDSIANDKFCDSSCGNCYNGECYDTFNS